MVSKELKYLTRFIISKSNLKDMCYADTTVWIVEGKLKELLDKVVHISKKNPKKLLIVKIYNTIITHFLIMSCPMILKLSHSEKNNF